MIQDVEHIRKNFIKKLGTVWNKSEGEVEDLIKFDPVVRLLFNAIMFQYEDIVNRHTDFKKEIITDLAKRIMPDYTVHAIPSYGIIRADSSVNEVRILKSDKTFTTPRKVGDKVVDQKFIPVAETTLIPGTLNALIVQNTFINLEAKRAGEEVYYESIDTEEESTIWIGINIPEGSINSIKEISLFVKYDLHTVDDIAFFDELSEAVWRFGNRKCMAITGMDPKIESLSYSPNSMAYGRMKQRVLNFFRRSFITLLIDEIADELRSVPSLPDELLNRVKNTVWISAKCRAPIPSSFINDDSFHINAFPVMNCAVKEGSLNRNELIKDFQLEDNEFYFSLFKSEASIADDFVIRNSRYQSFDTKDLYMELRALSRIFNQSRSLFDKTSEIEEKDMETFREFSNIISDIELRNSKMGISSPSHHITTKEPVDRYKKFKYLTTYGEYGNGGKAGDVLKYEAPGLKAKSIQVLVPFNGGSNPVEESDLVDKFRYQLLSRDRIVTRQDIKALCYTIFSGENIENIQLQKTTVQGLGNKGLQRALRIEITLKKSSTLSRSQVDFYKKELLAQLESKSVGEWEFIIY